MKPTDTSDLSTTDAAAGLDPRRRRLLFRATHRGTTETDRLVGGYVAENLGTFDAATLDVLDEVMDLPDVDLADWLTGRRPIPDLKQAPILHAMREAALERARLAREASR